MLLLPLPLLLLLPPLLLPPPLLLLLLRLALPVASLRRMRLLLRGRLSSCRQLPLKLPRSLECRRRLLLRRRRLLLRGRCAPRAAQLSTVRAGAGGLAAACECLI